MRNTMERKAHFNALCVIFIDLFENNMYKPIYIAKSHSNELHPIFLQKPSWGKYVILAWF